ncbi:MAG: undecaprenyl-diphosphate phosphatase [Oscillospiraceae bacterium]|jgi:undecaprenyl-diphosphatase|nr:undecaprenyl-diphosphate phosphatase [Oscillospiraceae bacterium]
MDIIKSIVLGIIEGITEWLPISSTGHLILAKEFLDFQNVGQDFWDFFLYVIQLGAILAVVSAFFKKLNPFSAKKSLKEKQSGYRLWIKIVVACLPAAVLGLILNDTVEKYLENPLTVAITLILYGVGFIVLETVNKNRKPKISNLSLLNLKTALIIGGCQVLSIIPGTSRSGVTILGALLLGCSRYVAAEFSFFLAIPVMVGTSGLKLLKHGFNFTGMEIAVMIFGMLTAYIVSVACIKFLMGFVKKHDFKSFGYYRIALGIVVFITFLETGRG